MPHLEPTYLRYIYDGLVKGSIHPENAAELPEGLIGLYEEAFDERTSVVERQKLLQRFAILALLKKDVSSAFVAEVLGETEDCIQEFISTYSAWFNSQESGKYQLYHERLKVYLLQKLSEGEVHMLHEKLIEKLEHAIEEQKADEFEWYGLEFLAIHISVSAMIHGDGQKLLNLAYSQTHWQRQLKISKGYSWTKNCLNEVMTWASKYNDDEVIECGLQMVDLHHQEQNAAPQILTLVAEGDFDAALKRIEQFEGNDKEGLQRKFILYMLCLMELTLLDSKNKPFRKDGIEKLLKHLDEQLPVDHSVLNWSDFFPSYTLFLMFFEWAALGLDYLIVNKRTDDFQNDWNGLPKYSSNPYLLFPLKEKEPYSNLQFEVLKECARGLCSEKLKSRYLAIISTELNKQRQIEKAASTIQEALEYAQDISDDSIKCIALANISTELVKQNQIEKARFLLLETIECARGISNEIEQKGALEHISIEKMYCCTELAKQEKVKEAIECAQDISDDSIKSIAIANISTELAKLGEIKEAQTQIQLALECARSLSIDLKKATPLAKIATELSKQGKIEEAESAMQEALEYSRDMSFDNLFINVLKTIELTAISGELAKQGKIEEALDYIRDINDYSDKSSALVDLSGELAKQGKIEKALDCTQHINVNSDKSIALMNISTILSKNGKLEDTTLLIQEAFNCLQDINYDFWKSNFLATISKDFAKQGKFEEAVKLLFSITHEKEGVLEYVSTELAKHGKADKALECAFGIVDICDYRALKVVCNELAKQGKTIEALKYIEGYPDSKSKLNALAFIAIELSKQGLTDEALNCVRAMPDEPEKINALAYISTELDKQGKIDESASLIQEALEYAPSINDDFLGLLKSITLSAISFELAKQEKIEEALKLASSINFAILQDDTLKLISIELTNQEKIKKAIETARSINIELVKVDTLANIYSKLSKYGQLEVASSIIEECLKYARNIIDETGKISALKAISIELIKNGNWSLAEKTCLEITQTAERQDFFKLFGEIFSEQIGIFESLIEFKILSSLEARFFYLKGWLEKLKLISADKEITINTIRFLKTDIVSIEKILMLHSLNQIYFEKITELKTQRFIRTLNIQWAVEIKNQMN